LTIFENVRQIPGGGDKKREIAPQQGKRSVANPYGHAHLSKTQNHNSATGGKVVVADQIYRGRFLFASKNCENNKNTDFATLFLVLRSRGKTKEN
jgi:hypothetical protein